jgi:hydrogenase maturation protein HypF
MLTTDSQTSPPERQRRTITVRGAVQGVGFRPFVYRLAREENLAGWVNNSPQGVFIEVEGDVCRLERFLARLEQEQPAHARIGSVDSATLPPVGYTAFTIRPSEETGERRTVILPDLATCPDCLEEIRDSAARRYRYPFTNCTNCGPRFTIITDLPYDRPNTTMRGFPLCPACRAEYENPLDRRFHAQPIACPVCGPHLELWSPQGVILARHDLALRGAAAALRAGAIVAVKGLGGFHLMVDARDEAAVQRLRVRKHREEKPFALIFPDRAAVEAECEVSAQEAALLESAATPIVLLRRRAGVGAIAPAVAPDNPTLGVMLPYTPLHHLLMAELGFPIVATSGNLSDEPICIEEYEALERLGSIADIFLVHNRPIARHVDDSVVRLMAGQPMVLRRARGYAPLPVHLAAPVPPLLAVGGHLKNSVALAVGQDVFVSQHIGDLETAAALAAFRRVISDFRRLYAVQPQAVACDAHPDYRSTQFAQRLGLPLVRVQHHAAHVLAAMAEHGLRGPLLGVSWDGTGYGGDGTIWGGEFFTVAADQTIRRAAHWRPFRLPGGDRAIKEPRRSAIGLLYELLSDETFHQHDLAPVQACTRHEVAVLKAMLDRRVNAPRTSSVGRLFDAVAALLGLRQRTSFEGQAAMLLEWAVGESPTTAAYEVAFSEPLCPDAPLVLNWAPAIFALLHDLREGVPTPVIAAKFHHMLGAAIMAVAERVGEPRVVLTGGCFQNRYLLEHTVRCLREAGFQPVWPAQVPPNDGGIALGQILAAAWAEEHTHVSSNSGEDPDDHRRRAPGADGPGELQWDREGSQPGLRAVGTGR